MSPRELLAYKRRQRSYRRLYAERHPEDPRHGTHNFYVYWGCRCADCRAEHTDLGQMSRGLLARGLHEPSTYTIEEHRAFGEALCYDCRRYLRRFRG